MPSHLPRVLLAALAALSLFSLAAPAAEPMRLKEETRPLWSRSHERFIRQWLVLSEIPLAGAANGFDTDFLADAGGEAGIRPVANAPLRLADGTDLKWRPVVSWGDAIDLSSGPGIKRDLVGYAFTTISRRDDGKALLSIGSDEGVQVWVNGTRVLDRRDARQLNFDQDQVEVDLKAGDNTVLVKLEQHTGPWAFAARVLERGALVPRVQEIGPSFFESSPSALVLKTDVSADRADHEKVTVQAVAAGGKVVFESAVARGDMVRLDASGWPDGAYEIRCETRKLDHSLAAVHLPWFKGDSLAAARALVSAAATADAADPRGQTIKMLADMVLDRLGGNLDAATGNPWWVIHSPLMEFEELQLESAGAATARERPYGFYRLAWRDEIDDSPQFSRVYLPGRYDREKKWPLVLRIHGYNPANPPYVRWWSVDARHAMADTEYAGGQGVIYMEPHGRGNAFYLGLGDLDVVRAIKAAQEKFSVDPDRIYLEGDSMGGWGTWNVGTRHPDLFAAIAPIYGGVDYHSTLTEDQLAALNPLDRFLLEKNSSWAMADSLLNVPIFVRHGDVDPAVNVDFSRYGVRLLQRWGYNIRYHEQPGYAHEDMGTFAANIEWFLQQRRVASPTHVRLRTTELRNAAAYWVALESFARADRFMTVDAEIAGPNLIRLDTQNVTALTLTPGELVDATKPVKIVWNGEPQSVTAAEGRLALRSADAKDLRHGKNAAIAGPISDVINTPFAIVAGTVAANAAMKQACDRQLAALVDSWTRWQLHAPRVFKDTEISDEDAARYSLILIGGADANLLARRLANRIPLELGYDYVRIGKHSFNARDARVQFIYPNPLNPARYAVILAATSAKAMDTLVPSSLRSNSFDFTIETGPAAPEPGFLPAPSGPADNLVARGWFDAQWQFDTAYIGKETPR